jgi:5'-deoxynucleotidase YfbR-like HD superfamily hydrolase
MRDYDELTRDEIEGPSIPYKVYNLKFIQRYSITPRIINETVAEHSFFVATYVMELYKYYKFDLNKAVQMAIIHDFAESFIGDITLSTKTMCPELVKAVADAEADVMFQNFPSFIYELYREYERRVSVESLIVKLADTMQVKQYASNEVSLGNNSLTMSNILSRAVDDIDLFERKLAVYKR